MGNSGAVGVVADDHVSGRRTPGRGSRSLRSKPVPAREHLNELAARVDLGGGQVIAFIHIASFRLEGKLPGSCGSG